MSAASPRGRGPAAAVAKPEGAVPSWDGSDDELLDVEEASALLTVRPSTLRHWAREGRVPVIRLGPRATRWTRPLLREIVAAQLDRGRS
jgi:hypothetical protein